MATHDALKRWTPPTPPPIKFIMTFEQRLFGNWAWLGAGLSNQLLYAPVIAWSIAHQGAWDGLGLLLAAMTSFGYAHTQESPVFRWLLVPSWAGLSIVAHLASYSLGLGLPWHGFVAFVLAAAQILVDSQGKNQRPWNRSNFLLTAA